MRITDTLIRPALAGILSLAVAGTCLAMPGIALADDASADADAETDATQAASDGQALSFGGVTATVPSDYLVMDFEDTMLMATAEDGSVALTITNSTAEGLLPTDADELEAYFSNVAEQSASALGGTVSAFGTTEEDGTTIYVATIDVTGDTTASLFVAYVPLADGTLSVVQCLVDPTEDGAAEAGNAIVESIALASATEDGEETASAEEDAEEASVELTQVIELAGMQISLPEDFAQDESGDFLNESGDIMFGAAEQVAEDATEITTEEMDATAAVFAGLLGGEVLDSTMMENDDATVYAYAMVMTGDDVTLMGVLGFVPVADGSLSMVYGLCDVTQADDLSATLDAIFASIALA